MVRGGREVNLSMAAYVSDRILDEVIESLSRTHKDLVGSFFSPLNIRATPKLQVKRKSIHIRKLRPHSVVDSLDGLAGDDIPDLLPKGSEDPLEHLGKCRPRRPKTRAPTKPVDSHTQDLEEGLDHFFKRPCESPDPIDESTRQDRSEANAVTKTSPMDN
ncbi:crml-1 [Cordylochernes scorpioides]|uniref:Crml-1 n=1 Tax=Cordylochernes scorpioides TaxID=51811 RepID=A0ABY6LLQ0_9ARAC|nr:crml-1 [Cordylochernes scorpioides]